MMGAICRNLVVANAVGLMMMLVILLVSFNSVMATSTTPIDVSLDLVTACTLHALQEFFHFVACFLFCKALS